MSRYRKFGIRTWTDRRFVELSRPKPCAHYLYVYLQIGPNVSALPGVTLTGEAGLAEELDWPLRGFRQAFNELSLKGLVAADWKNRIAFIPEAIYDNSPESRNVVVAWRKAFVEIRDCPLKTKIYSHTHAFLEALPEAFTQAFDEGLDMSFVKASWVPFVESETEAETGTEKGSSVPILDLNLKSPSVPKQHERERTDFQKFWGPIEGHLRKNVVPEAFARNFAGIRILQMTGAEVVLAVPSAFIAANNGTGVELMTGLIRDSQVDLLRGRELRLKSIDDVIAGGLE